MFFQSVLLVTDFASRHEVVNDDLRFLARPGTLHRFTLTADQLPAMLESGKFFARKLDVTVDRTVLARLTERITAPDFTGSSQGVGQSQRRGRRDLMNPS